MLDISYWPETLRRWEQEGLPPGADPREYFGLDHQANKLAVTWRVYHDFGAALCDPRAAVRSKGEA